MKEFCLLKSVDMTQKHYVDAYGRFLNCSNWDEIKEERIKSFDEKEFISVENVLFIGPGSGTFEIQHFCKIIPDLKSATFIEPEKSSFDKLQKTLEDLKENVVKKSHMCKLEDWHNNGEVFDLVVMYHSLYYFKNIEEILDMCFRRLLRPGGVLYVESCDDVIKKSLVNHVLDELKIENQLATSTFKNSLQKLGKEVYKKHRLERIFRLEALEECADFLQVLCHFKRSKAEVLDAIRAVKHKGYNGFDEEYMYLVKNI